MGRGKYKLMEVKKEKNNNMGMNWRDIGNRNLNIDLPNEIQNLILLLCRGSGRVDKI